MLLIVTECHCIYLKLNEIIVFRKLKFIKIQSIKIYLKLEKMVKMLVKNYVKMVVNVEKLLKMVKNGDFLKFVKKW